MTVREELLYALESARADGKEVSGEDLAAACGVSRVAVWKAVGQLTREGWEIVPVKGRGYRLSSVLPVLSEGRIRAGLPLELRDLPIFVYDTTSSTNDRAKEEAGRGRGNALFVSERQSAGRGRMGRSFYSPPGSGVYFSYLFSSDRPLEELYAVTPFAAVSAARALEERSGRRIGIKWVNDLYLDDRKICGILTEAITSLEGGNENRIIVGIGINLTTGDFPEELKEKAGSLGTAVDRCALIARIVSDLFRFQKDTAWRGFLEEYTARSVVLGKTVELDRWGEKITGRVVGFDANGGLMLDRGEGEIGVFNGGEISLKIT